jgi:hypothetical protein
MRTVLIPLLLTLPALSETYIHNSTISNSIIGSNISQSNNNRIINNNVSQSNNSSLLSTKNIDLIHNFNSIKINLPAKVEIRYSSKKSIRINMEKRFIKNISTEVYNNRLEIGTQGSINTNFKINILINTPSLEVLDVSSTAEVVLNNFNIKNFKLLTSGTSKVTFLSGGIQNFSLNSKGTSKINLETIDIKNATIESTGTSKTKIKVEDTLSVKLSNISKVMYIGNPTIKKRLIGLGKLIKIK